MIRARVVAALAGLVLVGDAVGLALLGNPEPAVVATAPTPGPSDRTESLEEQVDRVLAHVEQIRGLSFPAPPAVRYASRPDLAAEVVAELEGYDAREAELDRRLLVALGQLAPDDDLLGLLAAAYGEQVAGFYDPETAELVVGTDDPTRRAGRLDEVTLAHELGHSLVDATIGLPDLDALQEHDLDAALAMQALIEGDASALMADYIEVAMSPVDALLLAREALELAGRLDQMAMLPPALQRGLEFPYVEGLAFVQALLAEGGWAAVDAAYASPPTTTLEVLDPGRYGDVEVRAPSAFGDPGGPWGAADRTMTFGALDLLLLLELPGNDPDAGFEDARRLALAWTGGAVRQWSDGPRSAFAIHLRHDPGIDLCTPLWAWYRAAHPDVEEVFDPTRRAAGLDGVDQDAAITCDADEVRIGIAPDLATAERAIAA